MIIDSGVITGSLVVSGSYSQTGSAVIDGNLTVLGLINATISGSVTSASYARNADTASFAPAYLPLVGGTISGNLTVNGTGSFNVIITNYESASVIYSSGSTKFGDSFDDTHQFTGSVTISGGPLQVNGSSVILTNQTSSMSVQTAATSSFPFKLQPLTSNQVLYTSFNGMTVGDGMDSSTFLGASAGNGAFYAAFSTFVGRSSGLTAGSASYSTFLGFQAGEGATEASESVFLGYQAGLDTVNAAGSTFIGYKAGLGAGNSTYSNLVGYKAGTNNIGPNNIIIGTNISLPVGRRDSINLGGVIFATGSYFNTTNPAYTGAATGSKVGILVVNPTLATLEIGGNVYAESFTGSFSGSITAAISSSYALSASYALNATTAEQAPFYVLTSSFDNFSGSVSTRVTGLESTASVLTSASASLVVASGSTSTRVTNLESTASVLTSASASLVVASGSTSTRLTDLEATASVLTTASASFAVVSASYSSMSGSTSTRLTNLESFSSSLDATFATDAQVSASIDALSSSLAIPIANLEATASTLTSASASLVVASGSTSTRLTDLESTASVLTTASASFATVSASFSSTSGSLSIRTTDLEATSSALIIASGSLSTRTTNLEATSSTLTSASASFASSIDSLQGVTSSYATTASLNSYTASNNSTVNSLAQSTALNAASIASLTSVTRSYATTGSNTFVGTQYVSNTINPNGFFSTASLFTDGGFRVTKDSYFSGSVFVGGDFTVFGTASVNFITSSTLIGLEFINLNTDLPSLRYAGINVQDSGSATGLTASFWYDSGTNDWIFVQTPTVGAPPTSSVAIFGPVSTLGDQKGVTGNYLTKGELLGGSGDHDHHITSSQIYDDGTTVSIPGNLTVTGSLFANSTSTIPFNVGPTSTYYGTVGSSIVGTNNVLTLNTGSFTAAKFMYTVGKGSSSRMGEILAVWNSAAGQSAFTDIATIDINSTTDVTATVSIVASQLKLNFETTSDLWTIKAQGTLI